MIHDHEVKGAGPKYPSWMGGGPSPNLHIWHLRKTQERKMEKSKGRKGSPHPSLPLKKKEGKN